MKTMVGVFDRRAQAEAVVAQLAALHFSATRVSVVPYRPASADGAEQPGTLVTVRDVPIDAQDRVSTILEMAGLRADGSLAPALTPTPAAPRPAAVPTR